VDKYKKLFKALELCAGPECCTECPYHGKTEGSTTCRARLLRDASVAIVVEEAGRQGAEIERDALRDEVAALAEALELAEDDDRPVKPKKPEPGLAETMECALKATMQAEYWRGQADGLKWAMRFYYSDNETLKREFSEVPEAGAEGDV